MSDVGPSTIALAAYNGLAVLGGSQTADDLRAFLDSAFAFRVTPAALQSALENLQSRARVSASEGKFRALGPRGVPVTRRDRSGDGWTGWLLSNRQLLDEVLTP